VLTSGQELHDEFQAAVTAYVELQVGALAYAEPDAGGPHNVLQVVD
jgi:hypothetical protein